MSLSIKRAFYANLGLKHGIYGSHVSLHQRLDLKDLIGPTSFERNNMDTC